MSKTAIFPICLISMIASAIFYQFKGNPRDKYKNKTEMIAPLKLAEFQSSTLAAHNDAVPTIQSAMAIAKPLLAAQEAYSVTLDNEIWSVCEKNGNTVKVDKATGKILDISVNK